MIPNQVIQFRLKLQKAQEDHPECFLLQHRLFKLPTEIVPRFVSLKKYVDEVLTPELDSMVLTSGIPSHWLHTLRQELTDLCVTSDANLTFYLMVQIMLHCG